MPPGGVGRQAQRGLPVARPELGETPRWPFSEMGRSRDLVGPGFCVQISSPPASGLDHCEQSPPSSKHYTVNGYRRDAAVRRRCVGAACEPAHAGVPAESGGSGSQQLGTDAPRVRRRRIAPGRVHPGSPRLEEFAMRRHGVGVVIRDRALGRRAAPRGAQRRLDPGGR